MAIAAGNLDRRITFERLIPKRDAMGGEAVDCWERICTRSAQRLDVSDGERFAAGELSAELGTRWRVRYSKLIDSVGAKDRITYMERIFNITGKKETMDGRNQFLEFTTATRND